jgi:hypothetical protein
MEAHEVYEEYERRVADCVMLMRLMTSDADRRAMRLAAQRWRMLAAEAAKTLAESCHRTRGSTETASPAERGPVPA